MAETGNVKIKKNGPYLISGGLPLIEQTIGVDSDGQAVEWRVTKEFEVRSSYALCRCGQSANKPFCDGSHARVGFDGTETAERTPYDDAAEMLRGPRLSLRDEESLCAFARFCDANGQVWDEVERTDEPAAAKTFVAQVNKCPSGRLVAWDNESGEAVEEARTPRISVTEDPEKECAGPIWVEGGVEIESSEGFAYEVRNRVTLCRCGASENKPFCDGAHASVKFTDEN